VNLVATSKLLNLPKVTNCRRSGARKSKKKLRKKRVDLCSNRVVRAVPRLVVSKVPFRGVSGCDEGKPRDLGIIRLPKLAVKKDEEDFDEQRNIVGFI